jgi:hypothetical protein
MRNKYIVGEFCFCFILIIMLKLISVNGTVLNLQTFAVIVACMFETDPSSGGLNDGLQDAMSIHVEWQIFSHALNVNNTEAKHKL